MQLKPNLLVLPGDPIIRAVERINKNHEGIVLVCDADGKLIGVVTDGDIRRAVLARLELTLPVTELLARQAPAKHPLPLARPVGTDPVELLELMQTYKIRHIPLLDAEGRAVELARQSDLAETHGPDEAEELAKMTTAVVMAGGFGKRLRPLTENTPKPMLPLGDKPLLEVILSQLIESGIEDVHLTTHYHSDKIKGHFEDGSSFGLNISYIDEDAPRGTAGSLSQIQNPDGPILVMNGDILTRVNFRNMLQFHRECNAIATAGLYKYELQIPYGVFEHEGPFLTRIREKPVHEVFINAGIYLLEPEALNYIPQDSEYNMPDLLNRCVELGHKVACFPIREYWRDIGHIEDYHKAVADYTSWE
jgi:dTDP-glucose pyrophosphorylase